MLEKLFEKFCIEFSKKKTFKKFLETEFYENYQVKFEKIALILFSGENFAERQFQNYFLSITKRFPGSSRHFIGNNIENFFEN